MESLVPLLGVIIKSCPAGLIVVPVGLAATRIHTDEINLFSYFPTPLGLSTSSTGFDMSPIISGEPCTATWGNH